jgi:hypothetical protein
MRIRNRLSQAVLAAALALTAATPVAAAVNAALVRPGNYVFNQGTSNLVPLNAAGATETATIVLTAQQRMLVGFTAECAVGAAAGNTGTWLNVDIEVRNVTTGVVTVLPPTVGTNDGFCSANGTAGADGWAMHTVNAFITLPAGSYRFRVRANIQNGVAGNTGSLGDSSLIVAN